MIWREGSHLTAGQLPPPTTAEQQREVAKGIVKEMRQEAGAMLFLETEVPDSCNLNSDVPFTPSQGDALFIKAHVVRAK